MSEQNPNEPKVVFISYSHDSKEHRERVLRLSERLRLDGFDTQLDRYVNGCPDEGWPRWMLNRLDEADFVLVVCTETYYRRFRGHEEPNRGRGVDWEGALITQKIYDKCGRASRFVPVLLDSNHAGHIPEPLRSLNYYTVNQKAKTGYDSLCDFLNGVAGVEPRPVIRRPQKPPPKGIAGTFDSTQSASQAGELAHGPGRILATLVVATLVVATLVVATLIIFAGYSMLYGVGRIHEPEDLLRHYQSFNTYEGKFKSEIDLPNDIRVILESELKFQRPDKLYANPKITLSYRGKEVTSASYLVVANGGTAKIFDRGNHQFTEDKVTSLDLQKRTPEDEPLSQIVMAVLKPYQLLATESQSQVLHSIGEWDVAVAPGGLTKFTWSEHVRYPDRWADFPKKRKEMVIPVQVFLDERNFVTKSTADLGQFFRALKQREKLVERLVGVTSVLSRATSETDYSDIVVNQPIDEKWFADTIPDDAEKVAKIGPPSDFANVQAVLKSLKTMAEAMSKPD